MLHRGMGGVGVSSRFIVPEHYLEGFGLVICGTVDFGLLLRCCDSSCTGEAVVDLELSALPANKQAKTKT